MALWLRRSTGWLIRQRARIGTITFGHAMKYVEGLFFDWLVYGSINAYAVLTYGPSVGSFITFCVMAPVSAFMCSLYLRAYDWSKTDWFGFEALKSARDDEGTHTGVLMRFLKKIIRMGNVPAFFVLSVTADPFMTVLYLRKGERQYDGLTLRERRIFWASVLVSNGYWTLRWTAIVEFARLLWSLAI